MKYLLKTLPLDREFHLWYIEKKPLKLHQNLRPDLKKYTQAAH